MQNIANPKKIDFKTVAGTNEGIITIEPLFPGYGMTLGNSLRRVLLSSLPGAAVIGVKIKGASHEFMALPHIKEDVLEMILNLKQLRLKVFTEEEVRLELKVKGKKVVTAGDIAKNWPPSSPVDRHAHEGVHGTDRIGTTIGCRPRDGLDIGHIRGELGDQGEIRADIPTAANDSHRHRAITGEIQAARDVRAREI